ncbi:hypothetical protein ACHHYP_09084 [Achlya hypogyna]|uniref:Secreted protein n=1 Tax=Achlya hypogyna TaxID=1202772 RepID=A0A1V9YNJ2_ACHHY|nr:hypothetical protein ACHHYP_09084 [Achlya hypogyna]
MVNVVRRVLPLLSLAAVAVADDASPCASQEARVAELLLDVASLTASGAQHQEALTAAQSQYKAEAATVSSLTTQLGSVIEEIAAIKSEKEALVATVARLQKDDTSVALKAEVTNLEIAKKDLSDKLAKLEADNAAHEHRIAALQAEVAASKESLKQVKTLKAQLSSAAKEIASLQDSLKNSERDLSFQAVVSLYYDQVAAFSTQTYADSDKYLALAKDKSMDLYVIHVQPWTNEALKHSSQATETIQALYATHAAATVDPLLAQLQEQAAPHVPIVKEHLARAQTEVVQLAAIAQAKFELGRATAVSHLKTQPAVAPYAQKIVDAGLVLCALPIAYLLLKLAISIVWFVISTTLYLATCCGCCGLVGRKPKTAREVAQPIARQPVVTAPTKVAAPKATKAKTPASKAPVAASTPATPSASKKSKKGKKTQ